ncbi:hypothetical protein NAF17_01275 [Mucilaginibacter sp. RB4R14]|uniref:hypothetical protein n=1 Tax=Mucilaginibacter aurantiaciroseus TaxID=2949308 RepID=UPI002091C0DB|nr:hypothetical protein [Mucilaginibacter aurantiaciroseus]MCO5934156.1 hypothetical protein [Mucilaginibacter aurantiaciroseus]
MKQLLFIATLSFLITTFAAAQDSLKTIVVKPDSVTIAPKVKTNLIIYGDVGLGFGVAGAKGPQISTSINYQFSHNLFTLRYIGIADLDLNFTLLSPFTAIPGIKDNGSLSEYALLYGLRFPKDGHAFSFALGASTNNRVIKYKDTNNQNQRIEEHYVGLPFEINIMWFKKSKERFRIYHIIPVGGPTGFGGSIGFKLSGNVSKHSYAALGIVYGLGFHKQY